MISIALNDVFKNAVIYAKEQRHEYLTIEHIFLSLLRSEEGREIVMLLDADPERLESEIVEHIDRTTPVRQEVAEPFETVALARAINDMMTHIHASGRSEADIGDMLVAIFMQEHAYALYLMRREGISRVDILEVISHSVETSISSEGESDAQEEGPLAQFTIELVSLAQTGKIDPVVGRLEEIDRVMQTLCRRKKNNPLL